jgi:TolB-like protein
MYTDMVGYTALGQRNESLSLSLVDEQRKLIRPILSRHNGREVKTMGDAFLVEFPNALDAVRCAYDIQRATREFNVSLPEEKRIHLRVGLHLGDVVESHGDISGDAVNVASRIEPLAEDGGVCLTRQVYDQVKGKFELPQESLGSKSLKNVSEPLEVYKVLMPWEQSAHKKAAAYPTNRIAVLPFTSFSLDPTDAFFADGVTDEIISAVAGISGLSVISRTSVIGYKGTTKKVKEIGNELEVGSILEGTFKKAGNKIRVTTQLIDVAEDRHLWAQNYDRNMDDVFEVQSDIARQVAEALRVRIPTDEAERVEKRPTGNALAYSLYLKGRELWKQIVGKKWKENLKKAQECFEQAVKEDQEFALGYVGQADCYRMHPECRCPATCHCHPSRTEDPVICHCIENAKAMVSRALKLDPNLAEAHATNGLVLMDDYKPRQAEEEFRKAVELKPSYALAHRWYSYIFFHQQMWKEGLEQVEKALELDPLNPVTVNLQAHMYYHMKNYGKALDLFAKAAEIEPTMAAPHLYIRNIYALVGMPEEARREASIVVELVKDTVSLVGINKEAVLAYYEDDVQTVRRLMPEIVAHFRDVGLGAYNVAVYYFFIGDKDKGFQWLEHSFFWKESVLLELKVDQNLDGVRNDPRFLDLLKRVGLN